MLFRSLLFFPYHLILCFSPSLNQLRAWQVSSGLWGEVRWNPTKCLRKHQHKGPHLRLLPWVLSEPLVLESSLLPTLFRLTSLDRFTELLLDLPCLTLCNWQTNPASPSNLTWHPENSAWVLCLRPQLVLEGSLGSHCFISSRRFLVEPFLLFHGGHVFLYLDENQSRNFLIFFYFQSYACILSL